MGGYGAIRNGLKYYETFGYIAGLSSALILESLAAGTFTGIANEAYSFGDLKEAVAGDKNPKVLIKAFMEQNERNNDIGLPQIYLACGTEDRLINSNRDLRDFLVKQGVEFIYEEGKGKHDWDFWEPQIQKVLDWLPLDEITMGINSGNVTGE